MANRIQLRRGTATEWASANPVLAQGEPGIESDTGKQKFGNGVSTWTTLSYASQGEQGPSGPSGDAAYIQQVPRQANYLVREEKLTKYKAKLATASTSPCNIIALGDSNTEGTGSSVVTNRWQTKLQTELRYRHAILQGATFPWLPTYPRTTSPGMPVSVSGDVAVYADRGLGWKAGIINAGGSVTFTFTGTSFELLMLKGSVTGVMTVQIDGGAPVNYDTNSVSNPPTTAVYKWASGALTPGAHTVIVSRSATSTTGQGIYLNGMMTYNGDETAGIRVLDAGYHGMNSTLMTSARLDQLVSNVTAIGNIGAIIANIGTNDMGNSIPVATYKTNMELLVSKLRGGGYTGTIVLQNCYKGSGRDEATWQTYGKVLNDIAALDADIAYFDWRMRMPDIPSPYNASSGLGFFYDTLHMADPGQQFISSVLADYLSLRA